MARCARLVANSVLTIERRGYAELGREIDRSGVNTRMGVRPEGRRVGDIGVDQIDLLPSDIERADADRRPDPFVQIDSDEVCIEVEQRESAVAPATRRIDDGTEAACTRHRAPLAQPDHVSVSLAAGGPPS